MNEFVCVDVEVPSWLKHRMEALAESIGESVDALFAYFFANEVVHTSDGLNDLSA